MLVDDRERYVALHRALGFKFRVQSGLLRSFVALAEARGDSVVLAARVLEWARGAPSPAQRRNRLLTVRRFALFLHAEDTRRIALAVSEYAIRCRRALVRHRVGDEKGNLVVCSVAL